MFGSARTSFWHEKNELLVRNWSDFIAQTFEYHFFDQRFALVLFKRDPVLPNHGIHCFLLILHGLWSKIAPEKASPADGLTRGNIGQIHPRAKDGSRFETNIAPEGRFRGQEGQNVITKHTQDMGADSGQLSVQIHGSDSDPWI